MEERRRSSRVPKPVLKQAINSAVKRKSTEKRKFEDGSTSSGVDAENKRKRAASSTRAKKKDDENKVNREAQETEDYRLVGDQIPSEEAKEKRPERYNSESDSSKDIADEDDMREEEADNSGDNKRPDKEKAKTSAKVDSISSTTIMLANILAAQDAQNKKMERLYEQNKRLLKINKKLIGEIAKRNHSPARTEKSHSKENSSSHQNHLDKSHAQQTHEKEFMEEQVKKMKLEIEQMKKPVKNQKLDEAMTEVNRSPFKANILNTPFPVNFTRPTFVSVFDGTSNPIHHLKSYQRDLMQWEDNDVVLCRYFETTLEGEALEWFDSLAVNSISTFKQLEASFVDFFNHNYSAEVKLDKLYNLRYEEGESIRSLSTRWRKLCIEIGNEADDKVKIRCFINALDRQHPLFAQLYLKNPTSINQLKCKQEDYIDLEHLQREAQMQSHTTTRNSYSINSLTPDELASIKEDVRHSYIHDNPHIVHPHLQGQQSDNRFYSSGSQQAYLGKTGGYDDKEKFDGRTGHGNQRFRR